MTERAPILPPRPPLHIMAWAALCSLGVRVAAWLARAADRVIGLVRRATALIAPPHQDLSPVPHLGEERLSSLLRRLVEQQAARRTRPFYWEGTAERPTAVEGKPSGPAERPTAPAACASR